MAHDRFSPSQRLEYELLHDGRAVHDTARFRLTDFEVNGVSSWVSAIIKPDPDSGAATVPGGYINADTGELVIPEGASAVVMKKGIWKMLATAGPKQPQSGAYSWSEPLDKEKRVLTPEDYYSPFAHGGTVVFQPQPGVQHLEQFGPVYLFFPEWYVFVQPAFNISEKDQILHGRSAQVGDTAVLSKLVRHENSLIATIAFRRLMEGKKIAPQFSSGLLGASEDHRRSVFTYIITAMSPPDMTKDFVQAVEDRLQETRQLAEIQSIALGAFAAVLFHSREAEVVAGGRKVLTAARQRLQDISLTAEPGSQLLLMFTIMEIEP